MLRLAATIVWVGKAGTEIPDDVSSAVFFLSRS